MPCFSHKVRSDQVEAEAGSICQLGTFLAQLLGTVPVGEPERVSAPLLLQEFCLEWWTCFFTKPSLLVAAWLASDRSPVRRLTLSFGFALLIGCEFIYFPWAKWGSPPVPIYFVVFLASARDTTRSHVVGWLV